MGWLVSYEQQDVDNLKQLADKTRAAHQAVTEAMELHFALNIDTIRSAGILNSFILAGGALEEAVRYADQEAERIQGFVDHP